MRTRRTLMPHNCAAVALPPTAKTERPKAVLRLMNTNSTNNTIMISADTGTPRNCPPSQSSTSFSSIGTGRALVINSPIPRRALHSPSVATKLGTLNTPRSTPASVPISAPNSNTSRHATASGTSNCSKNARHTETKATIGPTLTSISPEIIISVIAQAAIPMVAASRSTFIWLFNEIKPGAFREKTR